MSSFGYKSFALLMFAVTALVLMCSTQIQVNLKLNITVDLPSSSFIWTNTTEKDSFSDTIEHAKFRIQTSNNDRSHQGHNLPGKDLNLTLQWHVMSKTGKIYADKIVVSGYRMHRDDED